MPFSKSSYKILKNHNIIVEYHEGPIDLNSYISFKTLIFNNPSYSSSLNYIVNFKNVNMNVNINDVEKYIDHLKQIPNVLGKKRVALLTRTPNQIVPTTIYKMKESELSRSVEIFSTYESALNWLQTDLTSNELINIFKELKK